jgi:PqqD family protein of HPr-rel-A system
MDGQRWRLNRRSSLHWRRLGDDWVVFDSGSGDTHQLDAVSAAALTSFETDDFDLDGLTGLISAELDLPVGETLSHKLAALVEQLGALGLIEPIAS